MRPFDLSKFRKTLTKSIDGLGIGFTDPKDWISTGNYTLNYLISGDFNKGIPLGKVTMFAGESGCLPATAKVVIRYDRSDNNDTVTVKDLKVLWHSTPYEFKISTPDGFRRISAWYDKGTMPIVRVTTESGLVTECATNHLLQTTVSYASRYPSTGLFCWSPAGELEINQPILTENWLDYVTSVEVIEPAECYDFTVDDPNHRYWGDGISSHNSGKSLICSASVVKNAQAQGIFVIIIDSENALDEAWLQALGVDTSEDKLLKLNMAMIDDVAKTISEFMKEYKALDERPQVLFVIDSVGMLMTPTDVNQFNSGEMKGSYGLKPKALGALIRNCVNMFGSYNVGLLATNHCYSSNDQFSPDDKISGGSMMIYSSSIVVSMNKLKLKEDEDGNKISQVRGIRAACKVVKSRYSKPFESVQIKVPYDTGIDPYSGLTELFEAKGLLKKDGLKWRYAPLTGESFKMSRKEWNRNERGNLDLIMSEFHQQMKNVEVVYEPDEDAVEPEIEQNNDTTNESLD